MIDDLLIFQKSTSGGTFKITDNLIIRHPTIKEICNFGEQKYFSMVSFLCSNPSQFKLELWGEDREAKVDWTKMTDYEWFVEGIFPGLNNELLNILFENLDISSIRQYLNNQNNERVLGAETIVNIDGEMCQDVKIIFDRLSYTEMVNYIRKMHNFEYKRNKPKDETTKLYMINRDRRIRDSRKDAPKKEFESQLKPMIASLINYAGFKYDYSTVWDLTIAALISSFHSIGQFINFNHTMTGIYSGNIDAKKFDEKQLTWIV